MNEALQKIARTELKKRLAQCTEEQRLFFKRMYSHKNLDKPIEEVVDEMDESRLDWAMKQVERTLDKT